MVSCAELQQQIKQFQQTFMESCEKIIREGQDGRRTLGEKIDTFGSRLDKIDERLDHMEQNTVDTNQRIDEVSGRLITFENKTTEDAEEQNRPTPTRNS